MSAHSELTVAILVFDDAEELDVVGPYEVLSLWAEQSAVSPRVLTFSADGSGVRLANGLRMVPHAAASQVGPMHVLVYPGGQGTRILMTDSGHLAWLRQMRRSTPLIAGVCTGSLVLAAAGLLAGRPATTHHDHYDELALADPSVLVDTEARFVDDGDIITAAGICAGIDMALHLIARLDTVETAQRVRHTLQYNPLPQP